MSNVNPGIQDASRKARAAITGTGTTLDGTYADIVVGVDPLSGALVAAGAQTAAIDTLQGAVTANGNGTVSTTSGYETLLLVIMNGAGTATLTIQGSLDPAFTSSQDALTLGLVKLSDSVAGVNTSRVIVSGVLAIAANTSYLYQIYDTLPAVRAVISNAASLGAGATDTGLSVKLYKMAVS